MSVTKGSIMVPRGHATTSIAQHQPGGLSTNNALVMAHVTSFAGRVLANMNGLVPIVNTKSARIPTRCCTHIHQRMLVTDAVLATHLQACAPVRNRTKVLHVNSQTAQETVWIEGVVTRRLDIVCVRKVSLGTRVNSNDALMNVAMVENATATLEPASARMDILESNARSLPDALLTIVRRHR